MRIAFRLFQNQFVDKNKVKWKSRALAAKQQNYSGKMDQKI